MPSPAPSPARSQLSFAVLAALLLAVCGGIFAGSGGYTLFYAHGLSYMSDDPKTCVNCHIMREHFDGWQKSSHHDVAVCNDCHLPHDSFVGKWLTKAENGYFHSRAFTLQDYTDPIRIRAKNSAVLNGNCIHCHSPLVQEIEGHTMADCDPRGCVRCHEGVGHGPAK